MKVFHLSNVNPLQWLSHELAHHLNFGRIRYHLILSIDHCWQMIDAWHYYDCYQDIPYQSAHLSHCCCILFDLHLLIHEYYCFFFGKNIIAIDTMIKAFICDGRKLCLLWCYRRLQIMFPATVWTNSLLPCVSVLGIQSNCFCLFAGLLISGPVW